MQICADCKYGVTGNYSHVYKGIPIGCSRPDDERPKDVFGVDIVGRNCFVPKENHADN